MAKKAFISVLATDDYLSGILVIYKCLKNVKSKYPFFVCVTPCLGTFTLDVLHKLGIKTIPIERRDSPKMPPYNKWRATYSKLEIFKLTQFEKIVYIDADMIVFNNIDDLFDKPHMSSVAAGCWGRKEAGLNSGLIVVCPNMDEYKHLVQISLDCGDTCQGDQNVIQKYFKNWHEKQELHLGHEYNIFVSQYGFMQKRNYFVQQFSTPKCKNSKSINIIHYIQPKPWSLKDKCKISHETQCLYDYWENVLDSAIKEIKKV